MEKLLQSTSFWILAGLWFVLQLLQAWGTPIHYDEAYYWMFSKQLAWGYFDHPPAVAFLIRSADTLFNGILGVRFFTIITQLLGFYLLWQLVENKTDKKLPFLLLVFCLPFFHILGIITTPDVPLLLSAIFFFFTYRNALRKNDWINYLLWGISMAAMLYSKYHGVLLIFFILLSNPRLFLNPKTYFAGAVGLLLWSPHLAWQYAHDFPSFRYHLQERTGAFRWYYPLEYLGNLLLIFNPFLIWLTVKLFRIKTKDLFERGLLFTLLGFLIFFTFQAFRDHVQPQWLVLCYIPFVLLLLNRWEQAWNKKMLSTFWISLPFLLALRYFMCFDSLPNNLGIHGYQKDIEMVEKMAEEKPVVFINSYKYPSLYSWYTGSNQVHSYNTYADRKNQFNIWEKELNFLEEDVYVLGAYYKRLKPVPLPWKGTDSIYASEQKYKAYERLEFDFVREEEEKPYLNIFNPYEEDINLGKKKVRIAVQYFSGKKRVGRLYYLKVKQTLSSKSQLQIDAIPPPDNSWTLPITHIGFCAKVDPWPPATIWRKFKLED